MVRLVYLLLFVCDCLLFCFLVFVCMFVFGFWFVVVVFTYFDCGLLVCCVVASVCFGLVFCCFSAV